MLCSIISKSERENFLEMSVKQLIVRDKQSGGKR